MSVTCRTVSVSTSATLLTQGRGGTGSAGTGDHKPYVFNNSAQTVYLGGSNVTINNGFPVATNASFNTRDMGWGDVIYGVVAATTADVRVLEVG